MRGPGRTSWGALRKEAQLEVRECAFLPFVTLFQSARALPFSPAPFIGTQIPLNSKDRQSAQTAERKLLVRLLDRLQLFRWFVDNGRVSGPEKRLWYLHILMCVYHDQQQVWASVGSRA